MIDPNLEIPHAADMELELLGMMLLKKGACIPRVLAILNVDDFYFSSHQIVFSAIVRSYAKGNVPNILSVVEELKKTGELDNHILETVLDAGGAAFSDAYAEGHSKTIKEKSLRRQIISLTKRLPLAAADSKVPLSDILVNLESTLKQLTGSVNTNLLIHQRNYFNDLFLADISQNRKYADRKSGFDNIDLHQIFSPGLYVIGATPACGKTTFAWQLLNQLAKNGEHCIFCSYEMSRLELYSKTLARELFITDPKTTLTSADIRRGAKSNSIDSILMNLCTDTSNNGIDLLELRDESIDDLLRLLKPLCNDKDKSPVVCLDYLQIIPPSNEKQLITDKARIDDIVHKLKSFQRDTNTTFIVISSFNRDNYYKHVSFESFKESGNIEYTADVVWALQMYIVNLIKIGTSSSKIRRIFDNAKLTQPRAIQFKCLKNRQGNNYDCFFRYFSAHDFFSPCLESDLKNSLTKPDAEESDDKANEAANHIPNPNDTDDPSYYLQFK